MCSRHLKRNSARRRYFIIIIYFTVYTVQYWDDVYRRVVDCASNGIGYKPSWQTISDVCAYKYAMHIYNNVYKTCIETFFTLVNTRIYLPENVSIHPSIVDRRRQVICRNKTPKNLADETLYYYFRVYLGSSFQTRLISSLHIIGPQHLTAYVYIIHISQQNRNRARHYIQCMIQHTSTNILLYMYICINITLTAPALDIFFTIHPLGQV